MQASPRRLIDLSRHLSATRGVAFLAGLLLAPAAVAQPPRSPSTPTIDSVRNSFIAPPADSRPMVRWWWFGTAVEKPEILTELQQMKADGIGGAELAFVYPQALDDPTHHLVNLPFLSTEMLAAVTYAQQQGRKLGLRIDVTLCSGWPYGGADTPLAEAASRLRTLEVALPANSASVAMPHLAPGESLLFLSIAKGEPKHWSASTARPLPLPSSAALIALTPSDTPRTVLVFIASHTLQQVKRAAVGAEGYVLDPFSRQAVETHLHAVGEPLVKAFGATPPYAIFSDSLEAYGADWTPALPAEFEKRRGYSLLDHLPELVGGGSPEAEKIRHDYGRTLTELVDENYLTPINAWADAHHTKFRSQTYGEPAVSLSSQRLVALPEGEGSQWRGFSTLRWATSANHLLGNRVTSGETFTWLHSPVFRATPLDMKAEADIDFITGENQLIFHGWPYSPPQAGEPGWSLYAAAVFNDHNPWHPVMPAVTQYIARISALLRRGEPANQVAVLLPTDDAWAGFSPGKVSVSGALQRMVPAPLLASILAAGYNYDFIDADAINRLGIHHTILVLPPTRRTPLETLEKISAFVSTGGKVIAIGEAPAFDPEGASAEQITTLSRHLFNPAHHTLIQEIAGIGEALHQLAPPDLLLNTAGPNARDEIGFIRRRLPNADLYFLVNTANHPQQVIATLATTHPYAEEWDPDTAAMRPASPGPQSISLAPFESRVFILSDQAPGAVHPTPAAKTTPLDLSTGWKVTFTSTHHATTMATLTDWRADPTTVHYSGEAIYTRDFDLPATPTTTVMLHVDGGRPLPTAMTQAPEQPRLAATGLPDPKATRTGPGMHAFYDPPVREAALVILNGRAAGALWHPPYSLDVSRLLKAGPNHLEIHVYNTALNAWSALPPHDYKPLIAKYGDRFQMQDLDQVQPLPSGLLGPVQLIFGTP